MAKSFANSGDPDQMPHFAVSDLGLHCLSVTLLEVSRLQCVNVLLPGVADQLQTNYASDLRHILKCVFEMNSNNPPDSSEEEVTNRERDTVQGHQANQSQGHSEDSPVHDRTRAYPPYRQSNGK